MKNQLSKMSNISNCQPRWLPEEQQYLKYLKETKELKSWKQITQELNKAYPRKKWIETQCRDRYANYIRYGINSPKLVQWTSQEIKRIFQIYAEIGSQWKRVSSILEGRSENAIKNKFYSTLRKFVRRINSLSCKKFYQVKYESLLKLLEFQEQRILASDLKQQYVQLKELILSMAASQISDIDESKSKPLAERIHRFNSATRYLNIQRKHFLDKKKRKTQGNKYLNEIQQNNSKQANISQNSLKLYQNQFLKIEQNVLFQDSGHQTEKLENASDTQNEKMKKLKQILQNRIVNLFMPIIFRNCCELFDYSLRSMVNFSSKQQYPINCFPFPAIKYEVYSQQKIQLEEDRNIKNAKQTKSKS